MRISVDDPSLCDISTVCARIYSGDGELVSRRYSLVAADDVAQTYDAECDKEGVRLEIGGRTKGLAVTEEWQIHIETFSCPGLRIVDGTVEDELKLQLTEAAS